MKTIPLTRGLFAIVDDDDFESLSRHKWFATKGGYAVRNSKTKPRRLIYMHREILNIPEAEEGDHKNLDTLDNRRQNLRSCTRTGNVRNRRSHRTNKLGIKGVNWHKASGKFVAQIGDGYRKLYLGCFETAEAAKLAYNEAAKRLHGEFANLN